VAALPLGAGLEIEAIPARPPPRPTERHPPSRPGRRRTRTAPTTHTQRRPP